MRIPDYKDIEKAHSNIKQFIHRTPVLSSKGINNAIGAELFFKCENFQKTGSFKYRGATNAIVSAAKENLKNGVCTHSSGNHAQALSLAAKSNGIKAHIVIPENAPQIKVDAVKEYGAKIYFCKPTLKAREEKLNEVREKTGAYFIHPYDNRYIISGQGTAAKELIEDISGLDVICAPVGGGGLSAGTAISSRKLIPEKQIVGCEPAMANDAHKSFYQKKMIPSVNPQTMADGLLTSLSELTYTILTRHLSEIFTCSEKSIAKALKLIYERLKIVAEPSGVVPLACIIENPEFFKDKKTGIIISGGNIDLQLLKSFLNPK